MGRQFKNGGCSCWDKIDKKLSSRDTLLMRSYGGSHQYLRIETFGINRRKQGAIVFASHCPFCGGRLTDETD